MAINGIINYLPEHITINLADSNGFIEEISVKNAKNNKLILSLLIKEIAPLDEETIVIIIE